MNSLYDFIIKPIDKRYNNLKKIGDKNLILNTSIENFQAISKEAIVVSVPLALDQPINPGDKIIVHHNIFRRWYDVKGKERNSRSYFNEDLYFCSGDQIYLYYDKKWRSFGDRCFVNPIKNQDKMSSDKTVKQEGFIKYDNKLLNHLDIFEGDLISFKPEREFEFVIENELLYCMKSRDIIIKHEDEGNKEKYNPSWAFSSERTDKSSKRRDCKHRGGCVCGSSKKCCRNKETSNI